MLFLLAHHRPPPIKATSPSAVAPALQHKRIEHRLAGTLNLEYSAFYVDGANGLTMIVFTPVSPSDVAAITSLL